MSRTLKTPLLWLTLLVFSLACALGAARFFPLSFPLVSVDITMDRQMALQQADNLAGRFDWGPEAYRSAASYNHDANVQHFVELTAGGVDAYRELLAGDLYSPYTWVVRLFREGEIEQTWVRFTPDGVPYGFSVGLPEDAPGEVLTALEARDLAEAAASEHWHIDWQSFEPLESSEDLKPGGRLDHTFTYRRQDARLGEGEGEYRVRLQVSGDRFTELTHFVHIPQSFHREYAEMRSRNQTLATVALIAMGTLLFFGGCVVGLFFMIRQGYLVWRTPVLWGVGIGLLVALTQLNTLPLQWMGYDTATSAQSHLLQQIVAALGVFVVASGLFSLIFMAGESLSRRAFPHHIQLWQTWHRDVAPSYQVLGMTCLGLLLVAPFALYTTTGYWFTTRTLGWWTPSSQLFHPDTLAQFQPWLPAVTMPLMAAFWEEALFRAVPIASAVLLGRRFGGTRYWLVAAVVLQAVIFAAGHADYPQQPYYARALELILPALLFAALYIRFGLYPAILLHFWYNVVWFSMPIFAASSPGIWVDQTMIVLLALTPFWVLLIQWLRQGRRLGEAPAQARNEHWQPTTRPLPAVDHAGTAKTDTPEPAASASTGISPWTFRALLVAGLAGLLLWSSLGRFDTQAPAMEIDRAQAEQIGSEVLEAFGKQVPDNWRLASRVWGGPTDQHHFILQEAGEENYRQLLGEYLTTPLWYLRWAGFEGDQDARAEEFHVYLLHDGSLHNMTHQLPESQPGAQLTEDDARALAEQVIAASFQRDPMELERIHTQSTQRPERLDWEFVYSDARRFDLQQGDTRVQVRIGGDQITMVNRFVHVPEEWSRAQRDARSIPNIIQGVSGLLLLLIVLSAAVVAIFRWSSRQFHLRAFFAMGAVVLVVAGINAGLSWPETAIQLNTAQPYGTQVWIIIGASAFGLGLLAGTLALIAGLLHSIRLPLGDRPVGNRPLNPAAVLAYGLTLALVVLGLRSVSQLLQPSQIPHWGSLGPVSSHLPWLQTAITLVQPVIIQSLFLLVVFAAAHQLSGGWQRRRPLVLALLMLVGFLIAGRNIPSVTGWLIMGTVFGALLCAVWVWVLRHRLALVIPVVAATVILDNIGYLTSPMFSGATAGYLLGSLLLVALTAFWYQALSRRAPA